jgi:hypothetical protein
MINLLILASTTADPGIARAIAAATGQPEGWSVQWMIWTSDPFCATDVWPDTWRLVRTDRWRHDGRAISALHTVAATPGVKLIDPTGLLGGSRDGYDANRPERPPVLAASKTVRAHAPRKRTNRGTDRTWG